MLSKYQHILDMLDWDIETIPILDEQVMYPIDLVGDDKSFVGIVYKDKKATIYHSRPLTEEDIVHELLHAKNPSWGEDKVNEETKRLIKLNLK